MKFSLNKDASEHFDVIHVENDGREGLSQTGVRTGNGNSGYQAVNLAYLLGARRILLLGFDMKGAPRKNHFHQDHTPGKWGLTNPSPGSYRQWSKAFDGLYHALKSEGVELINCTRDTALTIPWMPLEQAVG